MVFGVILGILLWPQPQEAPAPAPKGEVPASEAFPRTAEGHRITEPKKTKHVSPEWPADALRAGLTGRVVLECVIGTDGRVENAKVLQGYRSLSEAAAAAVSKWRYTPTKLDGQPVPVIMTVTVNFRLEHPPKRGELLKSVHESDPEIRWAAVRWLGRYRPITAQQKAAIEAALEDSSGLVRTAAKEAQAKLKAE